MHGLSALSFTVSCVNASKDDVFLVTGTLRLYIAKPIIGPPEIIFSGSLIKPPAASAISVYGVPTYTRKFLGFLTASPVTVTIRLVRGLFSMTAL